MLREYFNWPRPFKEQGWPSFFWNLKQPVDCVVKIEASLRASGNSKGSRGGETTESFAFLFFVTDTLSNACKQVSPSVSSSLSRTFEKALPNDKRRTTTHSLPRDFYCPWELQAAWEIFWNVSERPLPVSAYFMFLCLFQASMCQPRFM